MRLTDNTILITGGTSGIGRGLAEAFHALGNRVIITGRRQALLDEITAENSGMSGYALDVDNPAMVRNFATQIVAEHPDLNVLINNAGISRAEDIDSDVADAEIAHAILRTNLSGVLDVTFALLPHLRRQEAATVITTTSGLAFVPRANYPTYCASKAFLHSWLQSLRTQLRHSQVEVLELAPPYVQTELAGPAQAVDPHAMPLSEFIAEVMELLAADSLPDGEILVNRVKHLREAEASGLYRQVYNALNANI